MNVLFVSNDPSIFDAQSATRARMREYAAAIGTLHIISVAPSHTQNVTREDFPNSTALILHAVKGIKPFVFLKLKAEARAIVLHEQIEIVSAQDAFEYGWIAAEAVKGTQVKLHIQVHTDFLSPWFTKGNSFRASRVHMPIIYAIRKKLADRVLPRANGVRAVSQRVRDSLITHYGESIPDPTIIPITVSSDVPAKVGLPPHPFTFVLITVSRLEPEKRIQDILAAIAQIKDRYPSVGLMIVGEGRERTKLQRMVHALGLSKRVMFLGSRTDAWGLMQSAHAYIQASAYEGYGLTLVEAALARLPIITTDVGIVGEVLRGYDDILAAPVADPASLATHIIGLVEDNEAREQFAMKAQESAKAHLASIDAGPTAIARDLQNTLTGTKA